MSTDHSRIHQRKREYNAIQSRKIEKNNYMYHDFHVLIRLEGRGIDVIWWNVFGKRIVGGP